MPRSYQKSKGRKLGYSFIPLPRHILNSEEFAALSSKAIRLLIFLFGQFTKKKNGETNNGDFCATWTYMGKDKKKDTIGKGFGSRDTLDEAKKELLKSGFIEKTRQGGRHQCNLFGVTWLPIDYCEGKLDVSATKTASNKWKK